MGQTVAAICYGVKIEPSVIATVESLSGLAFWEWVETLYDSDYNLPIETGTESTIIGIPVLVCGNGRNRETVLDSPLSLADIQTSEQYRQAEQAWNQLEDWFGFEVDCLGPPELLICYVERA